MVPGFLTASALGWQEDRAGVKLTWHLVQDLGLENSEAHGCECVFADAVSCVGVAGSRHDKAEEQTAGTHEAT